MPVSELAQLSPYRVYMSGVRHYTIKSEKSGGRVDYKYKSHSLHRGVQMTSRGVVMPCFH